jgi:hypothetical protein
VDLARDLDLDGSADVAASSRERARSAARSGTKWHDLCVPKSSRATPGGRARTAMPGRAKRRPDSNGPGPRRSRDGRASEATTTRPASAINDSSSNITRTRSIP